MELDIEAVDEAAAVIRPRGRLNMVAAPRLREAIGAIVREGRAHIVVDLSGTEFMDSSGLGALISGLKTARQAGGYLRIAAPTEQVQTVLTLTNLDRVLRPHPGVHEAFGGA